jgi:hypothetical protein
MARSQIQMTFRRDGVSGTFGIQKDGSMSRKFAYSYDREDYTGAYETAEEALTAAVGNSEGMSNPPTTIYVGTIVEADPQAADHARTIINNMTQRAHVDYGDPAARYLKNVSPAQIKELDEAIKASILGWLQKQKLMPAFVRVEGIREYSVPFPGSSVSRGTERVSEVQDIGVEPGPQDGGN